MRVRVGLVAVIGSLLVAAPASGQAIRRERVQAFPVSITPFAGLGFGGQRANQRDSLTCATRECFGHKLGSAPYGGVEIQIPLAGTFGLSVSGSIGRPPRVICIRDACQSPEHVTQVHGAALVLWRFKARAPIYFGLGPGISYSKPGPVAGQDDATMEFGGVGVVAYDIRFPGRVGLRLAWWHWLLKPNGEGVASDFDLSGLAWDQLFSLGAAISLGS
jgi:hypothetical protein